MSSAKRIIETRNLQDKNLVSTQIQKLAQKQIKQIWPAWEPKKDKFMFETNFHKQKT